MTTVKRALATAVLCILTMSTGIGLTAGAARSAPAASFVAFEGSADSYAVGSQNRIAAALPLPIEAFFPRTRSNIDSQPRATGYAGVVDVPLGEVIAQFGAPSPLPNYCYASFPGEPSAECGLQPLLPVALGAGVSSGRGAAHADGASTNVDTTSADSVATFSGYASDAFQFTVGSARTASFSQIAEGVQLNGTEVVLQNVDIGGGLLQFEQIKATATAAADGLPNGAKATSSLTFNGVTVMGAPAPAPRELDLATLVRNLEPLTEAFKAGGLVIRPVEPAQITQAEDGTRASADLRGLVIDMVDPATGNGTTFTLARALASAYAVPAEAGTGVTGVSGAPAQNPAAGVESGSPAGALPTGAAEQPGIPSSSPSAVGSPPAGSVPGSVGTPTAGSATAPANAPGTVLAPRLVAAPEVLGMRANDGLQNVYLAGAVAVVLVGGPLLFVATGHLRT